MKLHVPTLRAIATIIARQYLRPHTTADDRLAARIVRTIRKLVDAR